MTEKNNSQINFLNRYHSKLSQLRNVIDEAKEEQSMRNLEARLSHDKQADMLLEQWLRQPVNEHLKSIGLNGLSKHKEFDYSLDELINDLSRHHKSRKKMTRLLILFLLETIISLLIGPSANLLFLLAYNYCNDERQTIIKLSNFLLSEDTQAILEVLITRELKINRSPLRRKIAIFYLFIDILWGTRIVSCFQNKFLPITKEIE